MASEGQTLIVADRREGGVMAVEQVARSQASWWHALDTGVPLEVKLLVPLVVLTMAAAGLFGYLLDQEQQAAVQATDQAEAMNVANAAVTAYLSAAGDMTELDFTLARTVQSQPHMTRIWVVSLDPPGYPVVASGEGSAVPLPAALPISDLQAAGAGTVTQLLTGGGQRLLTVVPVEGRQDAVVVETSLSEEAAAAAATALWIALAVLAVCVIEIAATMFVLEAGVLRRVRRIRGTVQDFGRSARYTRLLEGPREKGRDVLFNLSIEVDQKLVELGQHERADDVISALGTLALQSTGPTEFVARALDITRNAADLDTCLLVDARARTLRLEPAEPDARSAPELPMSIWVGALVRSTAATGRPIICDAIGENSRFLEADPSRESSAAIFVPLPGPNEPLGVMVGLARPGLRLSPASMSLMEAVASTLGESLQRSEAAKARQESEIKSEALSTVSHEMRNPINAMLGFTDLLLGGSAGSLNDTQRDYVDRVARASRDLLTLVNENLDLARVMAGSLALHREPVAVATEIDEVVRLLEPMANTKKVIVRYDAAPDAVAFVDRLRLRQVLTNLVSNAIKFTEPRGHVRIEAGGGADGVRISVIDTGVGIPRERQHLVFKEFARLRDDDSSGEPGIGLALTKRFVEAMGGFIRFTSSPGAGTVFDVWLPGERTPQAEARNGAVG